MMNPILAIHRRFVQPYVPTNTGGAQAHAKASRELAVTRSQTAYYAGLGSDLRGLRERNHFAEQIRATVRGAGA